MINHLKKKQNTTYNTVLSKEEGPYKYNSNLIKKVEKGAEWRILNKENPSFQFPLSKHVLEWLVLKTTQPYISGRNLHQQQWKKDFVEFFLNFSPLIKHRAY